MKEMRSRLSCGFRWGQGGTGGVFYIMGGGIAKILTKYLPEYRDYRGGDRRLR